MTNPTTPETAPEASREKLSSLDFLSGLKEKATKAYNKIKARMSNAYEAMKTGKGPFLDRLIGVLKAFFRDVEAVETAETVAKLETAEATTKVIQGMDTNQLVNSMLAPANTAVDAVAGTAAGAMVGTTVAMTTAVTGENAGRTGTETGTQSPVEVAPVAQETEVRDFLAIAVDTFKNLDTRRAATLALMGDKIDPRTNPNGTTLTLDEARAGSSFGLQLLCDLRQKFSNKTEFKTALDSFDQATSNTRFGLQTLKTERIKGIFKLSTGNALAFLKPITDKLNLPLNLGAGVAAGVWSKIGGTPEGNTESLDGIYFKLKAGELSDTDAEAIQARFAPLFPSTSPADRKQFVRTVGELIRNKKFPTNQQITDLAFSLDNADLLTLSNMIA